MTLRPIQPDGWKRPKGYSNGMLGAGRHLFVAGMIAWDADEVLVGDDFVAQWRQALANVLAVVREAGGAPEHIARLTIYVTDKTAYTDRVQEIGATYRDLMGKHFPAMALVEVAGLLEPGAQIEISADAILPPETD